MNSDYIKLAALEDTLKTKRNGFEEFKLLVNELLPKFAEDFAASHPNLLLNVGYGFDSSQEPFIEINANNSSHSASVHIYLISSFSRYVIGQHGSGLQANTTQQVLDALQQRLSAIDWLQCNE